MMKMLYNGASAVKDRMQSRIDQKNRARLTNFSPTLISSNCTAGFIYHWLGLQFRSPFINLFLTPDDFLTSLENLDVFLNGEIRQCNTSGENYPVGISACDTLIHFMHYTSFEEAVRAWNRRKERIDWNNLGVMLSNWVSGGGNEKQLLRFEKLPFVHKVVFTDIPCPDIKSAVYLKGYPSRERNIFNTQTITGKRYIDQFDYVDWINHLQDL